MCGIAGFTNSGDASDESLIRRMTATIVHRGQGVRDQDQGQAKAPLKVRET